MLKGCLFPFVELKSPCQSPEFCLKRYFLSVGHLKVGTPYVYTHSAHSQTWLNFLANDPSADATFFGPALKSNFTADLDQPTNSLEEVCSRAYNSVPNRWLLKSPKTQKKNNKTWNYNRFCCLYELNKHRYLSTEWWLELGTYKTT